MNYNENMSEALCLVAHYPAITGLSVSATPVPIGPFTMRTMRRIIFILDVGIIPSSSTIGFYACASNAVGGTYTTIPGTTISGLVATNTGIATVEVKAETIAAVALTAADANAGLSGTDPASPVTLPGPWIKGMMTIGGATSGPVGVIVLGEGGYYPASDYTVEDKNATTAASQVKVLQQLVA